MNQIYLNHSRSSFSPEASLITVPFYPNLSFVNIINPKDSKNRAQRRAVRSHVAYYQHHKGDIEDPRTPRSARSRRQLQSTTIVVTKNRIRNSNRGISEEAMVQIRSRDASVSSSDSSHTNSSVDGTHLNIPLYKERSLRIDHSYPIPWNRTYDPIMDYYISHVLIDTPDMARQGKKLLLRTSWFPFIMQSPTTFYAALTFATGVYSFQRKDSRNMPPLLRLQINAISCINSDISNPVKSIHDQTIGAVVCLCILESMYGDTSTYKTHMKGLATMVRMRGGLDALGLDGLLAKMILWVDYKHHTLHDSALHFDRSKELARRSSPFKHSREAGKSSSDDHFIAESI